MLGYDAINEELLRGAIYVDNAKDKIDKGFINVTLTDTIKVYDAPHLNVTCDTPTRDIKIPEEGLIIMPRELYIGATIEFTKTYGFVPILNESDELAALGLKTHITAGFGDNGFEGTWTLEIEGSIPVRIFPYMFIGTLNYYPLIGDGDTLYRGKYFKQIEPTASRLSEEYNKGRVRKKC